MGFLQYICCMSSEHLFLGTPLGDCLCMFTNSCQFVCIFQRRLLLNFEFLVLVKVLKKGTIFSSHFLTKVSNRAARSHLTKPLITLNCCNQSY